jgi:hypothetical protein
MRVFDTPGIAASSRVKIKQWLGLNTAHFFSQKFATSARLRFLLRRDSNKK